MGIKYIIFDFDGTLGDSKECSILATQKAFKEMNLDVPDANLIEYYMGIPIEKSFLDMANRNISKVEHEKLIGMFRHYYQQYEVDNLELFPGVKEMLENLKRMKIMAFVLSSKKTDILNRNLSHLNIKQYFKETIGSDKVNKYKPDPEGIEYILKKYGIPRKNCLMIGDATFDIQMGKAAKVNTCAVTWGSHKIEQLNIFKPEMTIDTPMELINQGLLK